MSHQEANGLVLQCSMQLVQCAPLMPSQISLNWPTLYVLKGCVAPRHDLHVAKMSLLHRLCQIMHQALPFEPWPFMHCTLKNSADPFRGT